MEIGFQIGSTIFLAGPSDLIEAEKDILMPVEDGERSRLSKR